MFKKIMIFLLILLAGCTAIVKHSPATISTYKYYLTLTKKYPAVKRYHFELAITLAYMGRIETAGKEFAKIDEMDPDYAKKLLGVLLKERAQAPANWRNNFKLGFCYYFLFDNLNGRIELAARRIKRGQDKGDQEKVERETKVFRELLPQATYYKEQAIKYLQLVAQKTPVDSSNGFAYAYMATIYGLAKEWETSLNLCKKALEITPEAYAIKAAYAEALRQNGSTMAATGQVTAALRLRSEQEKYDQELLGADYLE